jgi:hypothetical protein
MRSGKIRSINRRIEQAQDVMLRACFTVQTAKEEINRRHEQTSR